MRVYTVHIRPAQPGREQDIVLVKEGFCWPAFLFTFFWALFKRLWLVALALFGVGAVLSLAVETAGFDPLSEAAISLGFSVLVGFHGNDWRRWTLERRGYRSAGLSAGDDADAALHRFVDRQGLELGAGASP